MPVLFNILLVNYSLFQENVQIYTCILHERWIVTDIIYRQEVIPIFSGSHLDASAAGDTLWVLPRSWRSPKCIRCDGGGSTRKRSRLLDLELRPYWPGCLSHSDVTAGHEPVRRRLPSGPWTRACCLIMFCDWGPELHPQVQNRPYNCPFRSLMGCLAWIGSK